MSRSGEESPGSLVLAHRGDHREAPENTLAAFKGLGSLAVDGVEFDVQVTADDVPVVAHDTSIGGRPIETLAYAALQKLQGEGLGEEGRIPPLETVLRVFPERFLVNLELKSSRVSPSLLSAIAAAHTRHELVVTSAHAEALVALRREAPEVRTGLVSGLYVADHLAQVREFFVDVLSLEWRLATPSLVDRLRDNGIALFVWTVNSDSALERMLALGVDAIITDEPRRALDLAERLGRRARRPG